MDNRQFDDAIRAMYFHLRRSGTRRQGILAALVVALGGSTGADAALARPGRPGRPGAQGPCKGLKRPDNICTRDSECCTKVCNLDAGKANRDGLGRCRCKRAGESCTADRNCCQRRERPLACVDGVCGPPTCTPATCPQGCCRGTSCVPVASQTDASCGNRGMACAACGPGSQCVGGGCLETPPPPPSCDATTCADGCCNGVTCVPYASQYLNTCGAGGAACSLCCGGPGCACANGVCQSCDASSCPNGCCDGSQCVLYASQNASTCGSGGALCAACTAGPGGICNGGVCQYA